MLLNRHGIQKTTSKDWDFGWNAHITDLTPEPVRIVDMAAEVEAAAS